MLPQKSRTQLISGSFDQTIKIWDITTGQYLKTLRGHGGGILSLMSLPACFLMEKGYQLSASVSLNKEDTFIISSGLDGTIKLWHLETGDCIQSLIAPRPYEGMDITGVSGLTDAQRANLRVLGAIDHDRGVY